MTQQDLMIALASRNAEKAMDVKDIQWLLDNMEWLEWGLRWAV